MSERETKVINKHLMLSRNGGSWRVEPNVFEAVKAECVWSAKESSSQYLPRFVIHIDEETQPDLCQWRMAFSSDNSPEAVSYRGRDLELAQDLATVDFSKPFDASLAERIRAKYAKVARAPSNVDADLIVHGELAEIP